MLICVGQQKYVMNYPSHPHKITALLAGAALWIGSAAAAPLPGFASAAMPIATAADWPMANETTAPVLSPSMRRAVVDYPRNAAPDTVIIDTAHTYLYFVLGDV